VGSVFLDLYASGPNTLPMLAKSGYKTRKKKHTETAKADKDLTFMIILTTVFP
jgi:hypothetical protein